MSRDLLAGDGSTGASDEQLAVLAALKDATNKADSDALGEAMARARELGLVGSPDFEAARAKRDALRKPSAKAGSSYSPQQLDQLRKLFTACDTDGLGRISQEALLKELTAQPEARELLGLSESLSEVQSSDLFKDASSSKDPVLDFDGLEEWYEKQARSKSLAPSGDNEAASRPSAADQLTGVAPSGRDLRGVRVRVVDTGFAIWTLVIGRPDNSCS